MLCRSFAGLAQLAVQSRYGNVNQIACNLHRLLSVSVKERASAGGILPLEIANSPPVVFEFCQRLCVFEGMVAHFPLI